MEPQIDIYASRQTDGRECRQSMPRCEGGKPNDGNVSPTGTVRPNRLQSLDILRGLDLFLLVFLQPVIVAVGHAADAEWLNRLLYQLDHEVWVGFRVWDLVMPLFMFMSGVSMPFSFAKFENLPSRRPVYRKVVRRVVLLFLLGMVVQGNLLALDTHVLRFYSNTLQAIAAGYLIGSLIVLNLPLRGQIAATVVLLLVYWLPMTFCGDFTSDGNFAEMIDRFVLGRWRDGVYWDADGAWHFSPYYNYTWIWSSLTFGVTVMLGNFAGMIMRHADTAAARPKAAATMTAAGVALVAAGLLWHLQMPIIKRLWTCSMTLFSGGVCFLLMALFYWIVDIRGRSCGLAWLKIYGMNSITAYVLGEVVNFRSVAASLSYGLEHIIGSEWYGVWLTFANYAIVFIILLLLYRRRVFIKI